MVVVQMERRDGFRIYLGDIYLRGYLRGLVTGLDVEVREMNPRLILAFQGFR